MPLCQRLAVRLAPFNRFYAVRAVPFDPFAPFVRPNYRHVYCRVRAPSPHFYRVLVRLRPQVVGTPVYRVVVAPVAVFVRQRRENDAAGYDTYAAKVPKSDGHYAAVS